MSKMANTTHAKGSDTQVKAFPPGLPKPHKFRDWGRSLETARTERGLTMMLPAASCPLGSSRSFGPQMPWKIRQRSQVGQALATNSLGERSEMRWRRERPTTSR